MRPRLFASLALALLGAPAGAQQTMPEGLYVGEGTATGGSLRSLYAFDANALAVASAPDGNGVPAASLSVAFHVPADAPSAILHAETGTAPDGGTVQAYLYSPSAGGLALGAQTPSNGVVEFALTGAQLAQYRDASGALNVQLRAVRPSGAFTWSVERLVVLTPILSSFVYDNEGGHASGTLASLRAVDGDFYTLTTAAEASGNGNVSASFSVGYRVPAGTPSATLRAVTGLAGGGGNVQAFTYYAAVGGTELWDAATPSAQNTVDVPITSSQIATYRDASGMLNVQFRVYAPASSVPAGTAWNTDQIVLWAAPNNGPALPTGLTAMVDGNGGVDLDWTDNANNETGYVIERKGGADADFVQVGTAPADVIDYRDTTVSASTTYTYRVRATNASGDSPNSNAASAMTQAAPLPYLKSIQVDTDVVVAGASTTAVIQLSAPAPVATIIALSTSTSDISAPASIVVPAGGQTATVNVDTLNTGSVAVAYLYAKSGSWEQKAKVVCAPSIATLGAVNASVTPGQGGMWVAWSGPQDDIYGNSAAGYRVYRRDSSGSFVLLGSDAGVGQSFVDTTVIAGETYTYRVSLVDHNGIPVINSQEVTSTSSGGSPALSWQSPPTGTTQGTVNLSLSNPTDQETFVLYVDGTPFGVANSADTEGGSSGTLYTSIDTTTLTNGQHKVWVSSEIDPDQAVYYTSAPISVTVSNGINQSYNDGTTVIETSEHCEIRAKTGANPYTVTITDQGGNVVRTWSGYGPELRVCWDGNASNGSYAGDGEFNVDISTGDPGSHYYSKVQGNS